MPEPPTPEHPLLISLKLDDFGELTERERKLADEVSHQAASQGWNAGYQGFLASRKDELDTLRQDLREMVLAHPAGVWKESP